MQYTPMQNVGYELIILCLVYVRIIYMITIIPLFIIMDRYIDSFFTILLRFDTTD